MDQHYHPLVAQRLQKVFETEDWNALQSVLENFSNAHFRTAGYMIGERFLPTLNAEGCWKVTQQLMLWQPKAFVVTLSKALALRFKAQTLHVEDEGFVLLAKALEGEEHVIDRQKLVKNVLPALEDFWKMERVFQLFDVGNVQQQVEMLLLVEGADAGFVLLRTLRKEEENLVLLYHACRLLMKRGDGFAFNLASLIRSYFDLQDIKGTFSFEMQPYELSRLDTDFEVFKRMVWKE